MSYNFEFVEDETFAPSTPKVKDYEVLSIERVGGDFYVLGEGWGGIIPSDVQMLTNPNRKLSTDLLNINRGAAWTL